MIDEKKLIEELKERERKHICDFDVFNDAPEAQFDVAHCLQELQEIMDIVRTQPKVGEWIPVSERLPEEEVDVLVCIKETEYACYGEVTDEVNGTYYWMYVGYFLCGKWYTVLCHDCKTVEKENQETQYCQHEVVAWMPLPEPYRKDVE